MSDAIHDAVAERTNALVTRYVVVAEIIEDDGSEVCITITSPGLAQWAAVGFLRYAERKAADN